MPEDERSGAEIKWSPNTAMLRKFALLLAATSAVGQDLPVIKVTTRLVEINVVARDQHGPIANLTKDDFKIYDQDKPQQIALFQMNGAPAASPAPSSAQASVAQPGVFTNQTPASNGPSTVILLDGMMTGAMDQVSAKGQILKFLQQVKPQDRVAIFAMSGQLQMVQDFTGDADMLAHSMQVQQWGAGLTRNPQKPDAVFVSARAIPNAELASLVKAVSGTFVSNNVTPQAAQIKQECILLTALARHLARVSGRKNLIWVTDGFPLVKWGAEPEVFTDEVSQANHAFSDANVAVYPLDARGLVGVSMDTSADPLPAPDTGASATLIPMGGKGSPDTRAPGSEGKDMMNYVAHFTGGVALTDNNDLSVPMRKVVTDAEVTYTLGFYPDSASLDSKRHTLKVEVDRKIADLRYRQGYTASPEPPETRVPEKVEITEAIWSQLDATGITITARAQKVNQPQPGMLQLAISIPGTDVILQPNDKGWVGNLAVVYDERGADGKDLGRISETLNMQYDEEHRQKLLSDGIAFNKLVRPSPQASQLRIVIYDRNSGRVGSLAVKL
jgi:VWFA-related protein